jgi:hypothetical protein
MPKPYLDANSGNYFVSFSLKGKRYKRSTGSSRQAEARRAQRIVDGRLGQLKAGLAQVPRPATGPHR